MFRHQSGERTPRQVGEQPCHLKCTLIYVIYQPLGVSMKQRNNGKRRNSGISRWEADLNASCQKHVRLAELFFSPDFPTDV